MISKRKSQKETYKLGHLKNLMREEKNGLQNENAK